MNRRINLNGLIWFIILISFSCYLYSLIYTEKINLFIHPKMIIYVKFAFIIFIILSIYQASQLISEHKNIKIKLGYAVFILPLLIGIAINPTGLNADAVENKGIYVHSHSSLKDSVEKKIIENKYLSMNKIDMNEKNYLEVYDSIDKLKGKKISFTGFVFKDNSLKDNEFITARMMVTCCAADAQVVGIRCIYKDAGSLNKDEWVKIYGIIDLEYDNRSNNIAVIKVESLEKVKAPKQRYIYE